MLVGYTHPMKRIAALAILVGILMPLSANPTGQYYALSLSLFPYMTIPHYQDEIPMRTAAGTEVMVGALGYRFAVHDVSLEVGYLGTTASITHGFYRTRGFDSVKVALRWAYQMKENLSLFTALGTEINFYRNVDSAFASFSTAVGAEVQLAYNSSYRLSLIFPLTIHLRKEITAIQSAVGLRYQIFPTLRGGR